MTHRREYLSPHSDADVALVCDVFGAHATRGRYISAERPSWVEGGHVHAAQVYIDEYSDFSGDFIIHRLRRKVSRQRLAQWRRARAEAANG